MKTLIPPVIAFTLASLFAHAQDFPFGAISGNEFTMKRYERDTGASAVVLKEFGYAFISDADYHLRFKYHVRIKVLNKNGLDRGNIEVALRRERSDRAERIEEIRASSFALENGQVREERVDSRNIFIEDHDKYKQIEKFAIPNVRVGSIIELALFPNLLGLPCLTAAAGSCLTPGI